MTPEELGQHAAHIKNEVSSITTCSKATVIHLAQLLGDDQNVALGKSKLTPHPRNVTSLVGGSRKPSASKKSRGIAGANGKIQDTLDQEGRFRLATEVVNAALSILTANIKSLESKKQVDRGGQAAEARCPQQQGNRSSTTEVSKHRLQSKAQLSESKGSTGTLDVFRGACCNC